jgi:hypothetical protein
VRAPRLHQRGDRRRLPFANGDRQGRRAAEHLERRDPSASLLAKEELGDHGLEDLRQDDPHLLLLVGGKAVDEAVDRLGGGVRMEGAEDEEAGLGGVEGHPHRLQVAQLADEDHVGVLAERGLQGGRERRRVGAELAVGHDRGLRDVDELHGILDRDDVERLRLVDPVDEGGERRRLSRAGRPRDEDEAPHGPADGGDLLGSLRSSTVRTRGGIIRRTAAAPCSCRKRFTRNRALSAIA